ncbi:conjugal transfer protein TraG N-terminal domain-containing protein [Campylobacter lari]|uniref:conjugal transfer protein TraG N-terminal domain-containing protein n=1 Tax=Campylobacter lari TaxID=201 RepID=UPI00214A7487|nr:conjugal transfer protein TraG N-terminal domain-containing protein [Campylobacter lari]MCR2075897.1 conjugal transfer protein TraG N-terminal domain-containing protein [Campylobacter lari subsp. concheus]MCR2084064.1 conjugal transfer protein TraG N-terminal domain-containing protein [Campylobacter lari subsp. concheus]MCR2085689.1 conjugal transfer protein TraG N-terminal domain-containing protein [Campylobacter lari subsp. concheus]
MKRFYILFLSALIFAPSLLFGATNIDDNHIIFTWGYGEVANDILQAIKGITSGADYMVKIVMAIAFFTFAIKKVMDERTSPIFEFGKMIFIMVIIWQCFLRAPNDAQHRYMIHDNVTGKDYIVSQVPLGIGLTFSFMSRMEDSITKAMEKFYSTPQSTNFSNAGFGFTLRSTMDLPDLELSQFSPRTQKNLDLFFRNCVIYGMDLNKGRMDTNFRHSDNLYEDLFEIGQGSQLTLYFGKKDKGSIRSCTQAGALIKQDLGSLAPKIETIHARILGSKDENAYRTSMQGVWEIFSGQATQARSQLMQAMLINASRDSLINTAKMVGLDPNAVATNTAVAEQNFMSSMLTQGMMAQTYLPLAKAYLTVLIIGLSWIMALLSIMFGDFRHIKMFFTLCIWIVLWTPILSIINYFNDLNLSKSVQVLLDGSLSFSMSNSLSFFKQISEQTNFINYLVMLTPLLAFAVAKASEQGFVSVASSLSQTLQGASRSAGSFTNQQALSTETKIASPLGEEVIAKHAGVTSVSSALNVNGSMFSNVQDQSGATKIQDYVTGSSATVGGNGNVMTADIKGINTGITASNLQTRQENLSNAISNSNLSSKALEVASGQSNQYGLSETDTNAITSASNKALAEAYSKATGVGVDQAYSDVMSGKIGGSINLKVGDMVNIGAGGELSTQSKESESWYQKMSKDQQETFQKSYNESLTNQITKSNSNMSAFSNLVKSSDTTNSAEVLSSMDSYTNAKSINASVGYDGGVSMINNYIDQNYRGIHNKENVASAMKELETLAANGNLNELAKYSGVNSDVTNSGLNAQTAQNHYNPLSAKQDFNSTTDQINASENGRIAMRNTPKDIVGSGSGVAGEAQKAANAAEHKASSAIKERDEKIKKI